MEVFDIIENFEDLLFEEEEEGGNTNEDDIKKCLSCETAVTTTTEKGLCFDCDKYTSNDIGYDNKINNYSGGRIIITGKDSYKYAKKLMISTNNQSLRDYQKYKKSLKTLTKINNEKRNINAKLPVFILECASKLYGVLQQEKIIRRGYGRICLLGACLYYSCFANGVSRKPEEIIIFVDGEYFQFARGQALLNRMTIKNEKVAEVVNCTPEIKKLEYYLDRLFHLLDIDLKYIPLCVEIVDFEIKNLGKLMGDTNSRTSTKAPACCLIVSKIYSLGLTNKQISKISDTTVPMFERYYQYILVNRRAFKKILTSHGVYSKFKK